MDKSEFDELEEILNAQLPDSVQGKDRAEYVAAGIALNAWFAMPDATVGDMDAIFRALFQEGYNFAKEEHDG